MAISLGVPYFQTQPHAEHLMYLAILLILRANGSETAIPQPCPGLEEPGAFMIYPGSSQQLVNIHIYNSVIIWRTHLLTGYNSVIVFNIQKMMWDSPPTNLSFGGLLHPIFSSRCPSFGIKMFFDQKSSVFHNGSCHTADFRARC